MFARHNIYDRGYITKFKSFRSQEPEEDSSPSTSTSAAPADDNPPTSKPPGGKKKKQAAPAKAAKANDAALSWPLNRQREKEAEKKKVEEKGAPLFPFEVM